MDNKIRPHSVDKTQGNDALAECIGPNAGLKWQLFRKFFGCQDPLTIAPPREKCPNYKCHSLFEWARHIWKKAWVPGNNIACDEQACKMQRRSAYKTRCRKFKRIGDGIQADCLADDGYTLDFYFRNKPVDNKWTQMGLSPLHARLMHMFSRMDDQGHEVNMDNLYNSMNFARASFNLEVEENGELVKKRVKTQGVTWGSGRGVPACVKQEEPRGKAAQDAARGTTNLAVLRGDPSSQDLLVGSCYDQKLFYMLSHIAPSVNWVEMSKKVWSNELKKQVKYNFLR